MKILSEKRVLDIYLNAEKELINGEKIKFSFERKWSSLFPANSGVYAIFENNKLLYIGESANIKERMKEIKRTYNHSFRKKLGKYYFEGIIQKNRKYNNEVEEKMNNFFKKNIYLTYISVNFGRIEIESFLIDKYQEQLLNSKKKRK